MEYNMNKVSERFSAPNSDIIIRSSDGVHFQVHRENLALHSGIFPGEEMSTRDEIVNLPESSEVLELLFQYMYRQRQPELSKIDTSLLSSLAHAVEKYEVFSATEVCKMHMWSRIDDFPLVVLQFAAQHGYHDICDIAA
ncbi:hypothetical protein SERLADRAFT_456813, partial [Serpula lacrymans var. lacrymans S7.9]